MWTVLGLKDISTWPMWTVGGLTARGKSVLGRKRGTATNFCYSNPLKNQLFVEGNWLAVPFFQDMIIWQRH